MKKIYKFNKKGGNAHDFYELARYASYVLNRYEDYEQPFKANYRDDSNKKNILIVNNNKKTFNMDDNRYDKNTVEITNYTNDSITLKWRNRCTEGTFKYCNKEELMNQ